MFNIHQLQSVFPETIAWWGILVKWCSYQLNEINYEWIVLECIGKEHNFVLSEVVKTNPDASGDTRKQNSTHSIGDNDKNHSPKKYLKISFRKLMFGFCVVETQWQQNKGQIGSWYSQGLCHNLLLDSKKNIISVFPKISHKWLWYLSVVTKIY